jgi:hypothetical protein
VCIWGPPEFFLLRDLFFVPRYIYSVSLILKVFSQVNLFSFSVFGQLNSSLSLKSYWEWRHVFCFDQKIIIIIIIMRRRCQAAYIHTVFWVAMAFLLPLVVDG